jgi:hypothetical protein
MATQRIASPNRKASTTKQRIQNKTREEKNTQKITPFLWFDGKAEEAMNFYVSVFKNSKVLRVIKEAMSWRHPLSWVFPRDPLSGPGLSCLPVPRCI